MGSEKPHRLRSAGELVFMAPPTLACDGQREDSIECVPVLFVAITRRNVASLDQETRVAEQMVGSDFTTISTCTRLGGGGSPPQAGSRQVRRRVDADAHDVQTQS